MKTSPTNPMNEEVTAGIRVQVETQYQFQSSNPEQNHYVFAYRIRIKNLTEGPVQLLNRHWEISDCGQDMRVVDGSGVVGQQPILESGREFVYVSGCKLSSEIGKMVGYYEMENLITGKTFKVRIPQFVLEMPFKLN